MRRQLKSNYLPGRPVPSGRIRKVEFKCARPSNLTSNATPPACLGPGLSSSEYGSQCCRHISKSNLGELNPKYSEPGSSKRCAGESFRIVDMTSLEISLSLHPPDVCEPAKVATLAMGMQNWSLSSLEDGGASRLSAERRAGMPLLGCAGMTPALQVSICPLSKGLS